VTAASSGTEVVALLERRHGGIRSLDRSDPLEQVLLMLLADGASAKRAEAALEALKSTFVDWNEVRVSSLQEIATVIEPVGPRRLNEKAQTIRDFLATIYSRFNRMSLAFLLDREDKLAPRKIERLMAYMSGISPALPFLLECYRDGGHPAVDTAPGPLRVLGRVGLIKKGTTPTQARKALEEDISRDDWLVLNWGLHQVAEKECQKTDPLCRECGLKEICETAPGEIERAEAEQRRELERIAKEEAKESARRDKEERERRKTEDLTKKREAAEKARIEREEAAKKKAESAQKAKDDKKAAESAKKTKESVRAKPSKATPAKKPEKAAPSRPSRKKPAAKSTTKKTAAKSKKG
jgi:endonuclease III